MGLYRLASWTRTHNGTTYALGRAKVLSALDGLMVPVEDAEETEDESSSHRSVLNSPNESRSSSSSSSTRSTRGSGMSGGRPVSFAFANARWRSLIMAGCVSEAEAQLDSLVSTDSVDEAAKTAEKKRGYIVQYRKLCVQ